MKKLLLMRRTGPSVALILWALGTLAATSSAQSPVDWNTGDPVLQLHQRLAEQAPPNAAIEDFEVAATLARVADIRAMRLRADFNVLAARAAARPSDQTLGRELQALEDRARDLDAGLNELDGELRGLVAHASELVSVKDRVYLLASVLHSTRNGLQLMRLETIVRREDLRRSGLSFEQSQFENALKHAETAALKCLESARALKDAVDEASSGTHSL